MTSLFKNKYDLFKQSSKLIKKYKINQLPVKYEQIKQYKNDLLFRSTQRSSFGQIQHKINCKQSIKSQKQQRKENKNQKTFSFTNFNQTQATFNRAQGISHRIRSSNKNNNNNFRATFSSRFYSDKHSNLLQHQLMTRPSTQLKNHRNVKAKLNLLYSPLDVINTKINQEENLQEYWGNQNEKQSLMKNSRLCKSACSKRFFSYNKNFQKQTKTKNQFLKKGTAIDKSLLMNILKNKIKSPVKNGGFSSNIVNFSNARENKLLVSGMKKQIPNSLKDIIGAQQMIKMSKILTGVNLKSVNLNRKIDQMISYKLDSKPLKSCEDDDHQTLQSIKRW